MRHKVKSNVRNDTRRPKPAPVTKWWRNLKKSSSAHGLDLEISVDGKANCRSKAIWETPSSSGDIFSKLREFYPFRCLHFGCPWAFISQELVTNHTLHFHLLDLEEKCDWSQGLKIDEDVKFNMSDEMDLLEDAFGPEGFLRFPRDSEMAISSVPVPLGMGNGTELNADVNCSNPKICFPSFRDGLG